jgi:hypothetical protein
VEEGDATRHIEIARLATRLSEAMAQRTALLEEAQEFSARLHDIRAAFGNPFFYSHPENADESVANFTGASSHRVVLPTVLALKRVERELDRIKARLREFGVSAD